MSVKTLISIILAMALSSSGLAFAQPNRHHEQRERHENNGRWSDHRDNRNGHWNERGAGPNHDFRRGQRLPMEYRHRHYVVEDWRGHHLSAPPRGYHWVQTGGDYVLIAISSGVILQLLLSN